MKHIIATAAIATLAALIAEVFAASAGANADDQSILDVVDSGQTSVFGFDATIYEPDQTGPIADTLNDADLINADAIASDLDNYYGYVDFTGGDSSDAADALAEHIDLVDIAAGDVGADDVDQALEAEGIGFDVALPEFWDDMVAHLIDNDVEYDGAQPYINADSIESALSDAGYDDSNVDGGDLSDLADVLDGNLEATDIAADDIGADDISAALDGSGLDLTGVTDLPTGVEYDAVDFGDGFGLVEATTPDGVLDELVTPLGDFAIPTSLSDIFGGFDVDPSDVFSAFDPSDLIG